MQTLRETVRSLEQQLATALAGRRLDQESRRAALNLMEDAVAARRAERHENEERRKVEEELREAHRRKDQFLATLAHELRGPLAPLRSSLEVLKTPGVPEDVRHELIEIMERQLTHLAHLVDDLMEVSRITRGRIELRPESVSLATIVERAVEASKPLIDAAGHTLILDEAAEPVFVRADSLRLVQVLVNLLNNAAKYTESGGTITLTTLLEGGDAVVRVKDTGAGIPPEQLSHIFELFTQLNRTYNRAQGGLGIGLTLARQLVELHGGLITAQSEGPGHGSTFEVRLPTIPADLAQEVRGEAPNTEHSLAQQRILVVDDSRDSAESLCFLLKRLGAEAESVNDGGSALERLHDFHPTSVVMDIGMPDMDGFEVARRIRQLAEGRELTLIALTGWGQPDDRQRSKEAGFNHHLVKPLDVHRLCELLQGSGAAAPAGG